MPWWPSPGGSTALTDSPPSWGLSPSVLDFVPRSPWLKKEH